MSSLENTVEMSAEDRAFREKFAVEFHELFKIPGNALNLATMVAQQMVVSLKTMQQEAERRYARPILVRVEYDGAVRATVQEADEAGLLSVLLEERVNGEYTTSSIDSGWHKVLSDMVLSQTAFPGDVWFITTNAAVENALEKATGFFDESIRNKA